MTSPFIGTWTYRSFHNDPGYPLKSFDQIALAQAELVLAEAGPQWLAGTLNFPDGRFLEITGVSAIGNGRHQLRMRASGAKDSPTYGWVYDYVGTLAAEWRDGDRQVPAIVGTVTRSAYHEPNRRAGESFSFVAVRRLPAAPKVERLPQPALGHLADREHRLHHAVWHLLRNSWSSFEPDTQRAIDELGWKPPRPARRNTRRGDLKGPIVRNGSGEDFLFFHRQMMFLFRMLMEEAGEDVVPWETVPAPGEEGDEVPPAWAIPANKVLERRIAALKTDAHYWSRMRPSDLQFKDPTYLSTLTLGEFGSLIEFSIHGDMHYRWSGSPRDPRTNAIIPAGRPTFDVDPRWDDPKYDWLGDFYSSHVNPLFWRLHGWIDDRIADWCTATRSCILARSKRSTWMELSGLPRGGGFKSSYLGSGPTTSRVRAVAIFTVIVLVMGVMTMGATGGGESMEATQS
jgi:hypothetical protein